MQKPHILMRLNAHQPTRIALPDLNEVGLERQDILLAPRGKGSRTAFPQNPPISSRAPPVLVDVEAEVVVAEQEFRRVALDIDGLDVLASGDEVE